MKNTYKTSEVANIIGIHPNTVRLYEKLEFIPAPERKQNGYRVFTDLHLAQLKLVRTALQVEVLQRGLRKKAIRIIKTSASGDLEKAECLARDYLQQIKQERANAEEALNIVELLLSDSDDEKDKLYLTRKQAAEYLQIASDMGAPIASLQLAQMYSDGDGIPQNPVKAMELSNKVIRAGHRRPAWMITEHEPMPEPLPASKTNDINKPQPKAPKVVNIDESQSIYDQLRGILGREEHEAITRSVIESQIEREKYGYKDHEDALESGKANIKIMPSDATDHAVAYIVHNDGRKYKVISKMLEEKIAKIMLEILDGKGVQSWEVSSTERTERTPFQKMMYGPERTIYKNFATGLIETRTSYKDHDGKWHSLNGWDVFLNRVFDGKKNPYPLK